MDTEVLSSHHIKLEGQKNWSVWRFQVAVALRGADVYGVATGELRKPESEKDIAIWVKKDSKAQNIIVSRLSEVATVHVLTCNTAHEIWTKLHSVYEAKSATSTLMLQQRFLSLKFEGGELAVFLAKVQEMANKLKQAGEEVSERFLITKILMALPDTYKHFISAWESVETSKQNYDDLVARLMVEEERLKEKTEEENTAFYTSKQRGYSMKRPVNTKCFKCGKPGHFAKDCVNNVDNRKCFSCGKTGHLKFMCSNNQIRAEHGGHSGKGGSGSLTKKNHAFTANGMYPNRQFSWLIDSGASEHMSCERNVFIDYMSVSNRTVIVGDGRCLPIVGIGKVEISVFDGEEYVKSTLNNVFHVPELRCNLFSVASVTKKGYKVTMSDRQCLIYKGDTLCAIGNLEENSFVLDVKIKPELFATVALSEWHERLCHQNKELVQSVLRNNNIKFTPDKKQCTSCLEGKIHKLPFTKSKTCTTEPLQLVHVDLCGPMEVESIGNSRYFLLIKDDYSSYRVVNFLKKKNDAVKSIIGFVKWAERLIDRKVKIIRSDNGKEFVNEEMKKFCGETGIEHQTTIFYTPEQNGKSERDMRTLVEAARAMIFEKRLSKDLWAEAINNAVYVLNRTSNTNIHKKTPYNLFHNKEFDILKLNKVFGSEVIVHIPKQKRFKLDAKGERGIFVGYDGSKGYRIYFPNKNEVFTRRDIVFLSDKSMYDEEEEKVIYLDLDLPDNHDDDEPEREEGEKCDEETPIKEGQEDIEEEQFEDAEQNRTREEDTSEIECTSSRQDPETDNNDSGSNNNKHQLRRGKRTVKQPEYLKDYDQSYLVIEEEPRNYNEAMRSNEANQWKRAIEKELEQLRERLFDNKIFY